jgi:hypothetical protein
MCSATGDPVGSGAIAALAGLCPELEGDISIFRAEVYNRPNRLASEESARSDLRGDFDLEAVVARR